MLITQSRGLFWSPNGSYASTTTRDLLLKSASLRLQEFSSSSIGPMNIRFFQTSYYALLYSLINSTCSCERFYVETLILVPVQSIALPIQLCILVNISHTFHHQNRNYQQRIQNSTLHCRDTTTLDGCGVAMLHHSTFIKFNTAVESNWLMGKINHWL